MPKRISTRDPQIKTIGGEFYFRGHIDGHLIERKLDADNLSMAKLKRDELVSKLRSHGINSTKLTVASLAIDYVNDRRLELKRGEIRNETFKETESLIGPPVDQFDKKRRLLWRYFGPYSLSEVDEALWAKFSRSNGDLNLSNPRKVITHFLGWCKTQKYLNSVPEFEVKTKARRERINLTDDEALAMFKVMSPKMRLMASMILLMGMRPGEVTNLDWKRIDFENDCIILREGDTKTKKSRVIPLNPTVRQELFEKSREKASEFVFPNRKDKKRPMAKGAYRKAWQTARVAAGIKRKITPHDLRATFERFTHLDPRFTDTQREKMVGSSMKVQKNIYVKLESEHLRPLANAVQIEGLDDVLMGNKWERMPIKARGKRAKS